MVVTCLLPAMLCHVIPLVPPRTSFFFRFSFSLEALSSLPMTIVYSKIDKHNFLKFDFTVTEGGYV